MPILGLVDHSGIRVFLTPTLRPVEAGFLVIDCPEKATGQFMPPGEKEYRFYSHADNCFQYLPPEGISLFYGLMHSHLHGRKIKAHHYRNGVQLPDFLVDDKYDFYYQVKYGFALYFAFVHSFF